MQREQYSIEFSDEAEIDFDKSYEYYSKKNIKVANSFFNQVNYSFEKIKKTPFTYPKIYQSVRKHTIKKFPFVIKLQIL